MLVAGETAATPGSFAIAMPSCGVRVDAPPLPVFAPVVETLPGMTMIRFEPSPLIWLATELFAPVPIATVTITAATPITTPSIVSSERDLLRTSAVSASRKVCMRVIIRVPLPSARRARRRRCCRHGR